ncbi:MAG: potassium-transporting ATPase subunit F [Acidimicrobiales bacterium]
MSCSRRACDPGAHGRRPLRAWDSSVRGADAGSNKGFGAGMSISDGILLSVSALLLIYLGVALFKPEWF